MNRLSAWILKSAYAFGSSWKKSVAIERSYCQRTLWLTSVLRAVKSRFWIPVEPFFLVHRQNYFEAELAEQNHEVVSRISAGGQVTLRAIASENGIPPGATRVDGTTLEESYMAFMSARGRATVARQDGELLDVSSVMDRDEREIEEAVS